MSLHTTKEPGGLIASLQAAQEGRGWLSEEDIKAVAERTGVSVAKVIGVATFYSQFRLAPIGRHTIAVCEGTACHVANGQAVGRAICEHLGVEPDETTADGRFTISEVACLGCCGLAPVMMIDDRVFGHLTPEGAVKILEEGAWE